MANENIAQPNLNLGSLKDLRVLLPPMKEQAGIADFLDRKTASIDALTARFEKPSND